MVSMSLVPETDPNRQDQDGKEETSSLHNVEFPDGTSNATDELEQYSDVKEKENEIPLETASEIGNDTVQCRVRMLEEKLSAALSDLNDKEEMVKQHEKVAVEAVAGWEKALTKASVLKQELEAANEEKFVVENRAKQLDEALKECVNQLGQVREEQDQKIQDAILRKTREWDSIRLDLESQILQLQTAVESSNSVSDLRCKIQYLENKNLALKHELASLSEELEVRTIERDLNAQVAETASKQHLDNIRKLAKLEAENRNLKSVIGKSSSMPDHKSLSVSSLCVESLTDSQSDCGEQMNASEMNSVKMGINISECEPSCSDSWTTASFPDLDHFKKQKAVNPNLANSATEIELMDDFLEMEQLVALPANEAPPAASDPRYKLEDYYQQTFELQEKLERIEAEKTQLNDFLKKENSSLEEKVRNSEKLNDALEEQNRNADLRNNELAEKVSNLLQENADRAQCVEILKKQLKDYETALEALRIELNNANESKQFYEQRAICTDVELKAMAAKVDLLREEITEERARFKKLEAECRSLENAVLRRKHEVEIELTARLNAELKIKQEDLTITALKLAECQQTLMSLGNQLQSLTTPEHFLVDGKHSQLPVGGELIPGPSGDVWKMHSNRAFLAKREAEVSDIPAMESNDHAIGFTSSELSSRDRFDTVNVENGEAINLPNGAEEVSCDL